MKLNYYQLSLKKRIQILYILLTILCISVTGICSYWFASQVMEKNALLLKQNTLDKSVQVLDEHLRHIIVASYSLMLSETYSSVMMDVKNNRTDRYYQDLSRIQTPFDQLKLVEPSIDASMLITPIGDFYSTNNTLSYPNTFMDSYGSLIADNSWNTYWIGAHEDKLFQGNKRVLSLLLRPLRNSLNNDNLPNVFMNVNINELYIQDIIGQSLTNNQIKMFLLQKNGSMVVNPSAPMTLFYQEPAFLNEISGSSKGNFNFTDQQGTDILVNYANLTMNEDWVLVSVQSKADLLRPMQQIKWLVLVIMLACMLVALAFSHLLAKALLKPLNKLRGLMVQVEHSDLEVRFASKYEDEVSAVGHKFNRMLKQINTLIEEVKDSEREKRKSEVKALQAQVDPHFLYNTLNTIFWKSESGENKDVSEMIVSLSLLFRLGLNNGNETLSLKQELEHVEQYLVLQQKCYEDLFTYSISVEDPALYQVTMLKILLQPLVENSILHGFRDLRRWGHIRIEVSRREDKLVLQVTDNGHGMDVRQVNRQIEQHPVTYESYALSNIRSRLQLYYGEQASINFESIPDQETTVTLIIPLV
ncbi:sensor histidine kinase [Paenibacillus sp. sptzw28]|uniref:sensor histidine kinase n=1 Tax=Paenibacillus sp. sptzw28 TaxID=715179 RepID=UPI001C6E7387|nr:sensor histidine kinase [Paenibacillus sp. sptzw28]QYR20310.1 sensor histidine kinase [Paenibacillus sp. sptzw28]